MIYTKNIACIDPGKNGGIAWVDKKGRINAARCPHNIIPRMNLLVKFVKSECKQSDFHIFVEKQQVIGGRDTPVTAWALSANYNIWLTALHGYAVAYTLVPPRKWQKKTGIVLPAGWEHYNLRKKLLKQYASAGFPTGIIVWEYSEKLEKYTEHDGPVTYANADALAMLRVLAIAVTL